MISEIIQKEIKTFSQPTLITKKITFDWRKTVFKTMSYQNDKFDERSDLDSLFWNLASPQTAHFLKNLDLDIKDFIPYGTGETSIFQSWVLQIKFKKWAREARLGKDINSVLKNITEFGFGSWKIVPDEKGETVDRCDLRNIYFSSTDKTFHTVIEKHELTKREIKDKEGSWKNIDEAIEKAKKLNVEDDVITKYRFYERVGDFEVKGKVKYMHHIICGQGDKEVIVFEEEIKKNIYYYFSLDNAEGRIQGIGIYERLFKLQERVNALVNQNAQTTEIASLLLLRATDSDFNGNVLRDLESGQIINSKDLQQVGMDNRFFNQFIAELEKIEDQARKLCMTPEVISGENLPSGTPFRSMAALTSAAKSAFKITREDIGTDIANVILDRILPSLVKDWNRGELLEITDSDQDIEMYDKVMVRFLQHKVLKEKGSITSEELTEIEEKVKKEIKDKGRKLKVEKGYFNFDYGIIINPTGETYDKSQQNDVMINFVMPLATNNPAFLNTPYAKQMLENNGVKWWQLSSKQIEELQQGQQQELPQPKANMLRETQV